MIYELHYGEANKTKKVFVDSSPEGMQKAMLRYLKFKRKQGIPLHKLHYAYVPVMVRRPPNKD